MDAECGHNIEDYDGKCKQGHGHSYQVYLMKKTTTLQSNNIAIDFNEFKNDKDYVEDVMTLHKVIDHKNLNEVFKEPNVTAEFMCKMFYDMFEGKYVIAVKETHNSICVYDGQSFCLASDKVS